MPRFSMRAPFISFTPILAGLLDLASVFSSAYIGYWARFDTINIRDDYQTIVLMNALVFVLLCAASNAYKPSPGRGAFTLLLQLAINWSIAFFLIFSYLVFSKSSEDFSRLWLGYWYVLGFLFLLLLRTIFSLFVSAYRSKTNNQRRLLLIGNSDIANKIIGASESLTNAGYILDGFISIDKPDNIEPFQYANLIISQSSAEYIKENDVDEVWACLPLGDESYVEQLVYDLRHSTIDIRQVLRTPDLNLLAKQVSEFGPISTLDISCSPHNGGKFLVKQIEDYILGTIIFLSIIPALLVIALAIKITSSGPILFKQYRHGVDGKRFKVYKFRSMEVHSEVDGSVTQATADDPRVTKLGRFLRASSLDELPQFFNVLQGRMSIVGPRPHALAHNEYYKELIDSYMRRHMVKPGITGWAQISGYRGETRSLEMMRKRVEFDQYYIENWDVWLDIKIILLTPIRLFHHRNTTY